MSLLSLYSADPGTCFRDDLREVLCEGKLVLKEAKGLGQGTRMSSITASVGYL